MSAHADDLPPSGVATASDFYTLRADAFSNALAMDSNGAETVTDGPKSASAQVTFAEVGSSTLIRGTVTSGGVGQRAFLIEALQNGLVIAIATTGDDGTYLLAGLPGTVTIRVSDPEGDLATEFSAPLAPPSTFDAELGALVPALPTALVCVLATAVLLAARRALR